MKMTRLILMLLIIISCKSKHTMNFENTNREGIPYIFPMEVENIIATYLSKNAKQNTFLDLKKRDGLFAIYVTESNEVWVQKTNRQAFINGEFYPLLIDYDYLFASTETLAVVKERLDLSKKDKSLIRNTNYMPSYHGIFCVEFDYSGNNIKIYNPSTNH